MERTHLPDSIPKHEQDTIQELGLSNVEWMRYRTSGQLPRRTEKIMQRRFQDQMARAKEISAKKLPNTGPETIELKECTPESLLKMLADIRLVLTEGGDAYTKILEIAIAFDQSLKSNYFLIHGDKEAWSAIKNEARAINTMASATLKDLDEERSAELIEAMAYLADYVDTNDELKKLVTQCIEEKKYQTIGRLLEKKISQNVVFFVFYNVKGKECLLDPNKDEIKIVLLLLPSLVYFAEARVKTNGLEAITEVNRLIGAIFEYIKSNPEIIPELAKKIDFQKIADGYFFALNQKREEIAGGYPAHSTSSFLIETLMHLYKPSVHLRILPPAEMVLFLKKIYQEKVVKYSTPGNPNGLHYSIESLCEMCNIDFQTVKK